ncbi:hypothetical protein BDQ17DRAFT_449677 [Cyathus striatus]|nr:hypothetical protein BDQ17DRAFT_449677 [Cyathus striatus]
MPRASAVVFAQFVFAARSASGIRDQNSSDEILCGFPGRIRVTRSVVPLVSVQVEEETQDDGHGKRGGLSGSGNRSALFLRVLYVSTIGGWGVVLSLDDIDGSDTHSVVLDQKISTRVVHEFACTCTDCRRSYKRSIPVGNNLYNSVCWHHQNSPTIGEKKKSNHISLGVPHPLCPLPTRTRLIGLNLQSVGARAESYCPLDVV